MGLEFRVLGSLEVRADDAVLEVSGAAATVLGALLVSPARMVSLADLIGRLWGANPPSGPEKAVQSYLSRLRRALGPYSHVVVTRRPGYLIDVAPARVDAVVFERLVGSGLRALSVGAHTAAAHALREAESLWRGDAYADLPDAPFAVRERSRLAEMRIDAREAAIAAELAGGAGPAGGAGLIDELEDLVARYPLRERLWAHLIVALDRAGRQAEALAAYRRARDVLVEQVGVEPGADLRAAERAVLEQNTALVPVEPALPRELSSPGGAFVGRDDVLNQLVAALDAAAFGAAGHWLVRGGAEVGKTRLMAELAAIATRRGATVRYARGGEGVTDLLTTEHRYGLHILDDAHRAGPDDLRRLADHLASAGIQARLTVLTIDPDLGGADLGPLANFATRIDLTPLEPDAVRSLIHLYVPADEDLAAADLADLITQIRGVPGRAHRIASEWAMSRASARIGSAVAAMAAPRAATAVAYGEIIAGVLQLEQARMGRAAQSRGPAAPGPVCPYKGLSRYETDDAPYFFGRARTVAEIVAHLSNPSPLVVTGPSGSGKSSVVRAGLLPAIAAGALPGAQAWQQVVTTPSRRRAEDLAAQCDASTILVLDQFEEVFTVLEALQRDAYLDLVASAAQRGTTLVLTLRSDYVARACEFPVLARAIAENAVFVGALGPHELHVAITGPAQAVGLELEPGLLDDLLADVGHESGYLPLLSTTMLALWEARDGRRLTRDAYARHAGIASAVDRLGEGAYQLMSADEKAAARRILHRLADVDDEVQYVRRTATRADVIAVGGLGADAALAQMIDSRLVIVDGERVEVIHEALLRQWPRLRGWLDDDAAGRRLRRHLVPAARDWAAQGRDPADLYRGARLAAALDWSDGHRDELTSAEVDFLEASRVAAAADMARTRRANRRLAVLAGAAAVALVAALVTAVSAINERGRADTQRDRADRASLAADARRLSAQSLTERNLRLAMLEAVAATKLDPSAAARFGVFTTLGRAPKLIATAGDEAGDRELALAVSPDGSAVALGSREGLVRVYQTGSLRLVAQWNPGVKVVYGVGFDNRADVVAWGTNTYAVNDAATGRVVQPPRAKPPGIYGAVLPGSDTLVLDDDPHDPGAPTVAMDVSTGNAHPITQDAPYYSMSTLGPTGGALAYGPGGVGRIDPHGTLQRLTDVPTVAAGLSPDGATLAVATAQAPDDIEVWDLRRHQLIGRTPRQASPVTAIAWATNADVYASADDNQVVVWSGTDARATMDVPAGGLLAVALSSDGRRVYATGLDGALYEWDISQSDTNSSTARRPGPYPAEPGCQNDGPGEIVGITGGYVVVCSQIAVLDAATGLPRWPVVNLRSDDVSAMGASRTGRFVAVGSSNGYIQVWDMASGTRAATLVPDLGGAVTALAVSDDGTSVVAAAGTQVAVLDAHTGHRLEPVRSLPDETISLAIGPDSRTVADGRISGRVSAWRVGTPGEPAEITVSSAAFQVRAVDFSEDGRLLAIATGLGRPVLVDTNTWHSRWQAIVGTAGPNSSVAFSPDRQTLVAAGADGRQLVYDLVNGDLLATYSGNTPQWTFVTFLPDGRNLAVAGLDGSITIHALDSEAWTERACAIANRDMTPAEWARLLPGRNAQSVCPQPRR